MDRPLRRKAINHNNELENRLRLHAATKSTIAPKPRTAFGDVGNKNFEANNVASKTTALKKTAAPPTKPLQTTKVGLTVASVASNLKKDAPKATTVAEPRKWQFRSGVEPAEVKGLMPSLQNIQIKGIAKAFNSGHVIQRTTVATEAAKCKGIYDVDLEDDPQLVSEYINDIIRYLLELESKYAIEKNYLEGAIVTERHRGVLINWVVEVVDSFKQTKETLHMSVALIDRYLSNNKTISKANLQLVGVAAMFIAHKYEETHFIDIEDWLYICSNAYKCSELLKMEMSILAQIDFRLGRPTSVVFLRRYHKVVSATLYQHELGKYIIELALMKYELCAVKPSKQAAAACCLARWLLKDSDDQPRACWDDVLMHYSGYSYNDIANTVVIMAKMLKSAETSKLQSTRELYSQVKHQRIALHECLRTKLHTLVV